MTEAYIRFMCIILVETAAIFLPVLSVFSRDRRFSSLKTAGILLGYLFFVWGITLTLFLPLPQNNNTYILWSCITLLTNMAIGLVLFRTPLLLMGYVQFLFKNFSDSAMYFASLASFLTGLEGLTGWNAIWDLGLRFLILAAISLAVYHFIRPYLEEAIKYTCSLPVWKGLFLIPLLFFLLSCLTFLNDSLSNVLEYQIHMVAFSILWAVCIYTVHYVILKTLSSLSQSYAMGEQYRTSRLLAMAQTSQMARLQAALEQMQKTRHDFRHHVIAVRGLLKQNCLKEAVEYIDTYTDFGSAPEVIEYCPNLSANCILNYYLQEAKKHSIQVSTRITLPGHLPLPEIDFCTILGNLLSNALEACQRQESGEPSITVNISQTGDSMIILSVRNTYTHTIRLQEDRFLSSKHGDAGIGTASVQYLTDRYHGVLKYRYGNGTFEASLLLNPKQDHAFS